MHRATTVVDAARTVRFAALACVAGAAAAVVAFSAVSRPLPGVALAAGLLLGATNGMAAARLLRLPIPFFASSLTRIVTLTMIGIAVGLALGFENIWLVILGLGVAQLVLAAAAVAQTVRR
jgi:hypothetical protein